jgi:small subunit ribosomal protein S4e
LSRHLKRYSAPKHWGLKTKAATFAARPSPGPHPGDRGVPLLGIVRDLLGYAQDMREAKRILQQGDVSVDHVTRKDYKYAAGLIKLLRIQGKSWVRGGRLQLNLHDGTNVVLPGSDSPKYSVGDVIQMSLPDKEVKDHMKMEPGNAAIVSGGKNSGELGKIEKVEKGTGTQPNLATVSVGDREFQTLEEYIFVLGRKRPKIKVM